MVARKSIGLEQGFILNLNIEMLSEDHRFDYALKKNLLYTFKKQGEIELSRHYPSVNNASENDYLSLIEEYKLHIKS